MGVIPFAKSEFNPALTTFHARLHVAWTARYEIHVALSDTSEYWENDTSLGEFSYHGPALAAFQDRLYIAWTGTDEYAFLNVMSSQYGENFENKVTLREDGADGPALAVFNDRLYLSWTGVDEQKSLNIISSGDGVNFTDKHILGQSSIGAPALAVTPAGEEYHRPLLHIAWTAPDNSLNIASSADGAHFDFSNTRIDERSNQGPAVLGNLVVDYAILTLFWTGTDARLNVLGSSYVDDLPGSLGEKVTFGATSVNAPSLATFGPGAGAFVAWSGTDDEHHVNVMPTDQL